MRPRARRPVTRFAVTAVAFILCLGGRVAAEEASAPPFTAAQLEQLVAPIALYPDSLLAQVLMASTYPAEVAEAARWSQDNPGVTGTALEDAMQQQQWDPSVEALTALPQLLQMMNGKIDWTQQLGDALLGQQSALLDAVQRLRARAEAAGTLETTPQQKLARVAVPPEVGSSAPATTVYVIDPATPDEYSVPIYDPNVAYGTWPHPDAQPFYWHPPDFVASDPVSFAPGVPVGWAIWGLADWWQHRINVNVKRYNQFTHTKITRNAWAHDPAHRRDVPYRDRNVATRMSEKGKAAREDSSGRAETSSRDRDRDEESKSSERAGRSKHAETSRGGRGHRRHRRGRKR